ncbi:WD40-repeat-containing domain protein [Entophlyctis helioformis]|nr:WD40-repeat-containing domain protein [Entophlyctis helioformis]
MAGQSKPRHSRPVQRLPTELWLKILGHLQPHDLLAFSQTSAHNHCVASDNCLWRRLCSRVGMDLSASRLEQVLAATDASVHDHHKDPLAMQGISSPPGSPSRPLHTHYHHHHHHKPTHASLCSSIAQADSIASQPSQHLFKTAFKAYSTTRRALLDGSPVARAMMDAHRHAISCIHADRSGRVITGSWDGKVKVWRTRRSEHHECDTTGHTDVDAWVRADSDGIPSLDADPGSPPRSPVSTRSQDPLHGKDALDAQASMMVLEYELVGHGSLVECLGVCGNVLVSGSRIDPALIVWDLDTGRKRHVLCQPCPQSHASRITNHQLYAYPQQEPLDQHLHPIPPAMVDVAAVTSLALDSGGRRLMTGFRSILRLWTLSRPHSSAPVFESTVHRPDMNVCSIQWPPSSSGSIVFSMCTTTGCVSVWDVTCPQACIERLRIASHVPDATCLQVSLSYLAGDVLPIPSPPPPTSSPASSRSRLDPQCDEWTVTGGYRDGQIRRWRVSLPGRPSRASHTGDQSVNPASDRAQQPVPSRPAWTPTPDPSRHAVASLATAWPPGWLAPSPSRASGHGHDRAHEAKPVAVPLPSLACPGRSDWIASVDVDGCSNVAVSGSWDSQVRVWDTHKGILRRSLNGGSAVLCVAILGHTVLGGTYSGTLIQWTFQE